MDELRGAVAAREAQRASLVGAESALVGPACAALSLPFLYGD